MPAKISPTLTSYSPIEESINAITHLLGAILAIIGLIALLSKADSVAAYVSVTVYSGSLILMFTSSSLYHGIQNEHLKKHLKLLDHIAIYLLIAGTYTPILMLKLTGTIQLVSMLLIWLLALFGVGFKLLARHKYPRASLLTYLGMGWFVVVIIYPLFQVLHINGLWWLLSGGVMFSVGAAFYAAKSVQYTHAIWHLFVIAGCACHYIAVYFYVVT
ncbi:PAQR family membrane homeostasis protein TrhA [Aliikangiella sp. IMCC44632]